MVYDNIIGPLGQAAAGFHLGQDHLRQPHQAEGNAPGAGSDQYKPLVTYDNAVELKKIKRYAPHAGVVLRLAVANTGSQCELSSEGISQNGMGDSGGKLTHRCRGASQSCECGLGTHPGHGVWLRFPPVAPVSSPVERLGFRPPLGSARPHGNRHVQRPSRVVPERAKRARQRFCVEFRTPPKATARPCMSPEMVTGEKCGVR